MSQTTKAWTVQGKGSFDNLKYDENFKLSPLGDSEVLVKFHAASLNFRDLVIALVCPYSAFRHHGKNLTRLDRANTLSLPVMAAFQAPMEPEKY